MFHGHIQVNEVLNEHKGMQPHDKCYDHETSKADEKEMFRKQKEIMEMMGF